MAARFCPEELAWDTVAVEAAESLIRERRKQGKEQAQEQQQPHLSRLGGVYLSLLGAPPSLCLLHREHPQEGDVLSLEAHFIQNIDCLVEAYSARIIWV